MKTERKACAVAFLKAALAYYASLGITVERVMTDNGSCYRSRRFRNACRRLGLKHIFTRPYTPRTNGKAERFIQTALREWLYGKPYPSSAQRSTDMPAWLHWYNHHRPHAGIHAQTPASRLNKAQFAFAKRSGTPGPIKPATEARIERGVGSFGKTAR